VPRTRFARPLVAIALALALASCGDNSILGIAQSWTLQSVEGNALPFTVPNADHDVVITSGTANIADGGSYTMTFTGTIDGDDASVGMDQGSWTIASSTFNFRSSTLDGKTFIAAYLTDTFRAAVPGEIVGSTNQSFDMVFATVQ
jgi:hypothetical protein